MRECGLAAGVQQPGVQYRACRDVAVRASRMSGERQGAPVGTALHVSPHQPHLTVGRVHLGAGSFEGIQGLTDVAACEGRFAALQQFAAFLQRH